MTFQWPLALILLIIVPCLAALYVLMQSRRRKYALRYASVSLVAQAVGRGPGIKRHIPPVFYLAALTVMIVALARPVATIPVPSNTGTIILALDVSGSMLAEDVKPNRMDATKKAVRDFVEQQPKGVKIGLVSFSDGASLLSPPATDRKPLLQAISRLRPLRGTNMGAGLQIALEAVNLDGDAPLGATPAARGAPTPTPVPNSKAPPASIVLVSDGQSNVGPNVLQVADLAVAANIKVYTIGIGTAQGADVTVQGRTTRTVLDEESLRGVADKTGGKYYNAQDNQELREIYDELARERRFEDQEEEITFLLTGAALIISIMAGGLGLVWFNRLP
ncbi:MAG TPA: VWA domain-containing protein [Dehalococcoidia bacterium]|nr:VWA domain-containing protein [Dehalococcoidia bacterium]